MYILWDDQREGTCHTSKTSTPIRNYIAHSLRLWINISGPDSMLASSIGPGSIWSSSYITYIQILAKIKAGNCCCSILSGLTTSVHTTSAAGSASSQGIHILKKVFGKHTPAWLQPREHLLHDPNLLPYRQIMPSFNMMTVLYSACFLINWAVRTEYKVTRQRLPISTLLVGSLGCAERALE